MNSSIWKDFLLSLEKEEIQQKHPIILSLLKQIKQVKFEENEIELNCDNIGSKIYLEKKQKDIESLLFDFFNKKLNVTFKIAEKKLKIAEKNNEESIFSFKPTQDDIFAKCGLNKKYKFENYAVSSSNNVAFAAVQSVAKHLGSSYNPLFIHGDVGVGKTHLVQAAARDVLERDGEKKIFFCPGDQFINELIDAIREKNTARFRKKYRYLNMLIIDDIQFIAGKQTIQEEFFHTFNSIVSAGGQIILTSDRPPGEIKNLEDRLRSRFSGGLIVDIQEPDFELRTAILLIKAQEKNIAIDIDASKIISDKITDTRALEGTLLSIYAKIIGKKDRIDIESVEDFFSNKIEKQNKKVTPSDVVKTVCTYFNVKQSHLKGTSRTNAIALPRQITMYILRENFRYKLEEIATILKKKDHTTVIHGVDKIKRNMMKDSVLKNDIDTIVKTIESST